MNMALVLINIIVTTLLILLILAASKIAKIIDKKRGGRYEQIARASYVLARIGDYTVTSSEDKKVNIHFCLHNDNASIFHSIRPEYHGYLRSKLEKLIKKSNKNGQNPALQYAERHLYLGEELVLKWQNDVKH